MIPELVKILQHIDPEISDEDMADAIWLALKIKASIRKTDEDATMSEVSHITSLEENGTTDTKKSDEKAALSSASRTVTSDLFLTSQQEHNKGDGQKNRQRGTLPSWSPVPSALSSTLDLARSLRPFMRKVPHSALSILDEEATAKRIAEADVWIPVLDHALTRWLDVALVVDRGASMTLWQQTIAELYLLLSRQGAFRDVRIWELDTNDAEQVFLYAGTERRQLRNERELIDISRRRLILVLTDCVSDAWHSGQVARILEQWGRYNIVTLVQVLPQILWSRTALRTASTVRIQATTPGLANIQLNVRSISPWDDEEEEGQSSLPIPIITLEPEPIAAWSQVIARAEDRWIPGYKFTTGVRKTVESNDHNNQEETPPLSFSAMERLQLFRVNASLTARKLAGLLATVPISMPVVRLIQRTVLPESRQVHVAEVFLSGLLEVVSGNSASLDPDYVQYDFADGIREALLEMVPASDKVHVLDAISDYIESNYNQILDFRTLIANPRTREGVSIGRESKPFARMAAKVLRRFGGEYVALADWLEEKASEYPEEEEAEDDTEGTYNYGVAATRIIDGPTQEITAKVENAEYDVLAVAESELSDKQEETLLPIATSSDTSNLSSGKLPFIDPQAVPHPDPIINQNDGSTIYTKCICPSCFEEIYIGDCKIVSGQTPGKVLKEAPEGWWERQLARLNPERLDTPQYTQESPHRECHECGYLLPYNIDHIPSITLAVIGDTFAGKSHYIASLLHQIKEEWMMHAEGYASLTCLTPEVEDMYIKDYLEPLYKNKQTLPRQTQQTTSLTAKPLIYELTMHQSPDKQLAAINLLIYDAPGEDYEREARLVQFARFVFNSGAFIFAADPVRIKPIFQQLPSQLQADLRAAIDFTVEQRAAERMNYIISLYERYHGYPAGSSLSDTPTAVMVSKADLLEHLHLPDSFTFMKPLPYRGSVDLRDVNKIDQEVRELLKTYEQGDLLVTTRRFKRVKFFATSATGEPPDANGQFENVEPCRCLDPLLWILYEFGLIKASV